MDIRQIQRQDGGHTNIDGMSLLKLRRYSCLASKFATSDGVKDCLTDVLHMSKENLVALQSCKESVRWVACSVGDSTPPLCLQTLINWIVTLLCPGSNPSHLQVCFDVTEHPPANATLKLEFLDSQT